MASNTTTKKSSAWETDNVAAFSAAFMGLGGLFVGMGKTTPYLQVFGLCYAVTTLAAVKQIRGNNVGEFQDVDKSGGYYRAAIVAGSAMPVLLVELRRMRDRRYIPLLALTVNTFSLCYQTYWWKALEDKSHAL